MLQHNLMSIRQYQFQCFALLHKLRLLLGFPYKVVGGHYIPHLNHVIGCEQTRDIRSLILIGYLVHHRQSQFHWYLF